MRRPVDLEPQPARWSLRDRPGYPEAYPAFGLGEAERALRHGSGYLLWRDHKGIISGAASIRRDRPDAMVLSYTIEEREYLDHAEGKLVLPLVWKGSQKDNQRPYASCPLCARMVDVLVFAGVWCCTSTRHGLRHRSAMLAQDVRWSEELDKLEGAIATATALGVVDRTQARQVARRDALLVRLGGKRIEANALLRVVMTREWVRPVLVARP